MTEQEYEYGFSADDNSHIFTHSMGIPFTSAKEAERVGRKNYWETLRIYRRPQPQEWEEITSD